MAVVKWISAVFFYAIKQIRQQLAQVLLSTSDSSARALARNAPFHIAEDFG